MVCTFFEIKSTYKVVGNTKKIDQKHCNVLVKHYSIQYCLNLFTYFQIVHVGTRVCPRHVLLNTPPYGSICFFDSAVLVIGLTNEM